MRSSKDIFEQCTSTGSKSLALDTPWCYQICIAKCLYSDKCNLLEIFFFFFKSLPRIAKSSLPVDVGRSQTSLFKLPNDMVKKCKLAHNDCILIKATLIAVILTWHSRNWWQLLLYTFLRLILVFLFFQPLEYVYRNCGTWEKEDLQIECECTMDKSGKTRIPSAIYHTKCR